MKDLFFLFVIIALSITETFAQNTHRVEGKNFVKATSGIHADAPGTCIGWITNGSYAYYGNIDFGSGTSVFRANTSSIQTEAVIEVRLDSPTGTLAGKLNVINTGDWYKFETKEANISPISGSHDLYLVFTGPQGYLLNLAWFEFSRPSQSSISTGTRIQAENFVSVNNGIHKADINDPEGETCIGWILNGSNAYYGNYDFGASSSFFRARVSSGTEGGVIEIRLDSPTGSVAGKLMVSSTGDWNKYETKEVQISPISGKHDLYLTFVGGSGYLLNLAWFEFSGSGSGTSSNTNTKTNNSTGDEAEIFNNWNKSSVSNDARCATYFYLTHRTTITRIINYHWNGSMGQIPGQIGIKSADNRDLGTWQSVGTSGTGGAKNVNWEVLPNIVLEPGLYEITDSDVSTWSQNRASFGAGFTMIYGK